MDRLTEILSTYEDFELAFIYKYQKTNYTESSLEKILSELNNRGIDSPEKRYYLINEKLNIQVDERNQDVCPRCTSTKIMSVREVNYEHKYSLTDPNKKDLHYIEKRSCAVCGLGSADNQIMAKPKSIRKARLTLILFFVAVLIITIGIIMV